MKKIFPVIVLFSVLISCSEGTKKTSKENAKDIKTTKVDSTTKKKKSSPYITVKTELAGEEVVEKLKVGILEKGLTIFSEIPHHEGAEKTGQTLPFTHVIIFGNPEIGTKLMQCDQRMGLELPLKLLVSTNAKGKTQITYTNPNYYHENFRLGKCKKAINKMGEMLKQLTKEATKSSLANVVN